MEVFTEKMRQLIKESKMKKMVDECWDLYDAERYEEAYQKVLPIAEEGYAYAQNMVGLMYYHGRGVDQNAYEAHKWYMLAMKQNYKAAFQNMGNLFYYYGNGEDGDKKAYQCYLEVLDNAKPAVAKRALKMLQDHSVSYNREEEVRWMIRLASLGEEDYAEQIEQIYRLGNESAATMREIDAYLHGKDDTTMKKITRRFERNKEQCEIVMLGHPMSGKTTLSAAISKTLHCRLKMSDVVGLNELLAEFQKGKRKISIEYETENRKYVQTDYQTHEDCIKDLIVHSSQRDGAVLVVDPVVGISDEMKEQVKIARQVGIPYFLVFVNKCELAEEEEVVGELESEIVALLEEAGYYDVAIIRGSAMQALNDPNGGWGDYILELMEVMDEYIPDSEKAEDLPFVMPVENVYRITGRGVMAVGTIETGHVKIGDRLQLLGFDGEQRTVTVTGIERNRRLEESAKAGELVSILVRGEHSGTVGKRHVLASDNVTRAKMGCRVQLNALVYFSENIRILKEEAIQCKFRLAEVPGTLSVTKNLSQNGAEVLIKLEHPVAMKEYQVFAIYDEMGQELGIGRVIEI